MKRLFIAALIVALWLIFLDLSLPANALLFHNARRAYVKHVLQELKEYGAIVGQYQAHPPQASTEAEDAMYVTRAQWDMVLVEDRLRQYASSGEESDKHAVEGCLKQLERDIEDVPAYDDNRSKS